MERLSNLEDRMRPSERKVAELVRKDPAATMRMRMAGLAAMVGVSEPTVMRFCNALGIPVTHSAIQLDDTVEAMAMKKLDHTLSSLDPARSNAGCSTSVLDIAAQGKHRGATLIGIAGPSPLIADVGLILRTFEDTDDYTPTVSRRAGLVLGDVLATAVAVHRGRDHLERLGEMKEALSSFRGSTERDLRRAAARTGDGDGRP